jgi:predicted Zn-dependent peptidase
MRTSLPQQINIHVFDNGLVLLCETMDWLESAAFSVSVPAGCARDPQHKAGLANFTCEMLQRGCGTLDSRAFVEQLDRLGADRAASVTQAHTSFAAAALAESLDELLAVFAATLREPHLPQDQVEDSRQVCLQELAALEDDLPQQIMNHLRELAYPDPWGRTTSGKVDDVRAVTHDDLRLFHQQYFVPAETILSVAGKVDFDHVKGVVGELLGDWKGAAPAEIVDTMPVEKYRHLPYDSNQTQIGLAYDSVPYNHKDYFLSRGAVGALSDGMSSRLFTEVRENRGLCYAVYASCHSIRHLGRVLAYAGTSTDRAQETLDVMLGEIRRLTEGIDQTELERVQARTKSALIMQQESSSARANALSGDWYHLGRVRTMDELHDIVDGLTIDRINDFLKCNPPEEFVIVTLGERPLEISVELS